jgi:hypothetical protein
MDREEKTKSKIITSTGDNLHHDLSIIIVMIALKSN